MRLVTLPGVFAPRSDSRLLAEVVAAEPRVRGARVLDVFTGSGILALAAAAAGAREVLAVDVSRRAVMTVRLNARRAGLRVRARRGDLFAPLAGRRVDVITANPPYLPSQPGQGPPRGAARAWEGGRDGRVLVDRLIAGAPRHLAPGGLLLMVQSSLTGTPETLAAMHEAGLDPRIVVTRPGRLGPLAAARADRLRASGRLGPDEDREEIVVLAATSPGPALPGSGARR